MKRAELLVVKTTTITRLKPETVGPIAIETETDFKAIIENKFKEHLRGIGGYILVDFANKLWMCERDPVDPHKPYVRHAVKYHPMAKRFRSQQCWSLVLYKPNYASA